MIRSEAEYQEALRRLEQGQDVAARQRAALAQAGFAPAEVAHGMEPLLAFQAQLAEEVAWYENARQHRLAPLTRLTEIGRLLIALRLANGLTQRELAARLGVHEAVVSRDERNEYHGITIERAQRILDALHEGTITRIAEPSPPPHQLADVR